MENGLTLEKLVSWVEASDEATQSARREAERDRDYVDGYQWSNEEKATLKERKQPAIVINRVKPKVDFLVGMERQQRTDPKAYPRTPKHEQDSEAATDAIRYVCESEDWDAKRSQVFADKIVEGCGGIIVEVEDDRRGGRKVCLRRIPWDRLIVDHRSRELDYSDARFKGIYVWMDRDEALAKYPQASDIIEQTVSDPGDFDSSREDKPEHWYDSTRDRVRIVELYYRQGSKWFYCVFTKGGELIPRMESPYVDADGIPDCPIEVQACFKDRQNAPYGVVRQLIGPQDEINHRRSKAIHLLNARQVIAERGAVDDVGAAKKELGKPDGYIERNNGYEFEVVETNDMAQGNLAMLAEAKAEIDAVGANAALTGKAEADSSGRAIQARQQGGVIELGSVFDTHRSWSRAVYRQIWSRIKQFWTAEIWVRVTDDEQNARFVGLNTPTIDPMTGQIVRQSDVAQMDMDIIASEAPDSVNIQQEQFELLVQLAQRPNSGIPPEMIIEASTLRNKRQLLEKMKQGVANPQIQAMAQQMDAMAQELKKLEMEKALRQEDFVLKRQDQELKGRELDIKEVEVGMKAATAAQDVALKHEERIQAVQAEGVNQSQALAQSVGESLGMVAQAMGGLAQAVAEGNQQMAATMAASNEQVAGALAGVAQSMSEMAAARSKPRSVKRGPDGSYQIN